MSYDPATLFAHYVVEGQTFVGMSALLTEAKRRGFNGSIDTLRARVKKFTSWKDIAAPVDPVFSKVRRARETLRTVRKQEMDDLIARLDERKAALSK